MWKRMAAALVPAALVWGLAACSPVTPLDETSSAVGGAAGQTGARAAHEANHGVEHEAAHEAAHEAEAERNAAGYVDINAAQLAEMLARKDFVLVNVHIPYEGELPQTDLFIPYDAIEQHTDQLPDKNARIVLYCRSGNMSTTAAETLARLGYTNVYELDGGFEGWQASGHDLLHLEHEQD